VSLKWYAYLREIPSILCAWIQRCPDADLGLKYISYRHEEAPHPEYLLVDFARMRSNQAFYNSPAGFEKYLCRLLARVNDQRRN
jgi:hypothetical protein